MHYIQSCKCQTWRHKYTLDNSQLVLHYTAVIRGITLDWKLQWHHFRLKLQCSCIKTYTFLKNCDKHSVNTHNKDKLAVPKFRLEKVNSSFMKHCIHFFNKVPDDMNLPRNRFKPFIKALDYLSDNKIWDYQSDNNVGVKSIVKLYHY